MNVMSATKTKDTERTVSGEETPISKALTASGSKEEKKSPTSEIKTSIFRFDERLMEEEARDS
jgi:hypothetical protein